MKNASVQMMNAPDTASQVGPAFDVNQIVSASFCPIFGDVTATGTVSLQCSNDNNAPSGGAIQNTFVPTNWNDIPNATSAIAGGVGRAIILSSVSFRYIRAVYTRTSGGSSTVIINASFVSV